MGTQGPLHYQAARPRAELRVLQIIPSFYPATYWGGPVYSSYGLCNALAKTPGIELRVLTTDSAGPSLGSSLYVESHPTRAAGYDVYYFHRWFGKSFAPTLLLQLYGMIKWADIVHLTAVYSAPTIPTLLLARIFKKPVVWSPRGSLQRWSRATGVFTKPIWNRVCDRLCDPGRVVLHLTSEKERDDSLTNLKSVQAVVIPNGVCPPKSPLLNVRQNGALRVLYLVRLHPIKGIENLLHALAEGESDVSLRIYGDGDQAYRKTLQSLAQRLLLSGRVRFMGHANEEMKRQCFSHADICIVPSFAENFGMVVAEALVNGVPVIASKGTPWKDVEEMGCGLWVDNSPESLAKAISIIRQMPLDEMGRRGKEWMTKEFSWHVMAQRMLAVYGGLMERQSAP